MKLPLLSNTFSLKNEEQYDLSAGSFFADPKTCAFECLHCNLGNLGRIIPRYMSLDDVLMQVNRYNTIGVELIELRGGEPTMLLASIPEALEFISGYFPLRISTSGTRPISVFQMKTWASGFKVDIKLPPSGRPEDFAAPSCNAALGDASDENEYWQVLNSTLDIVDGMQFTYYTCTNFQRFSNEAQGAIKQMLQARNSPFIVDGTFLTTQRNTITC